VAVCTGRVFGSFARAKFSQKKPAMMAWQSLEPHGLLHQNPPVTLWPQHFVKCSKQAAPLRKKVNPMENKIKAITAALTMNCASATSTWPIVGKTDNPVGQSHVCANCG